MKKLLVGLLVLSSISALAESSCDPQVRFSDLDFQTQNITLQIDQSIAVESGSKHFQVGYIKIFLPTTDTTTLFQGDKILLTSNLGIALQSQVDGQQTNIVACGSRDSNDECETRFFSPDMTLREFNELSDKKLSITCI